MTNCTKPLKPISLLVAVLLVGFNSTHCGEVVYLQTDEPEIIIEKASRTAPEKKKPFDCCFEGTVPTIFFALLERMKNPELYKLIASEIPYQPNFFLLYGDSRTGKTHLVNAFIKEVGTSSVCRTGGELSLGHTDTISKIEALFSEAREKAEKYGSCIIWIDECEPALIPRNAMTLNNQAFHGASTLWKKIDDHRISHPNILVIAATNLFDSIDEAARKRVYGTAIQLPHNKANTSIEHLFPAFSHMHEQKLLKVLNEYRRTKMKNWDSIISCLIPLDDGIIADIAESAVRFALDDYYQERKPDRLKMLEMGYFQLKKCIAEKSSQNTTCEKELKGLGRLKKELRILTEALHEDALENVVIQQEHIERALAIVLNNIANSKLSLVKQANELAKEYWPLISTASGLIGMFITLKGNFFSDAARGTADGIAKNIGSAKNCFY